MKPYHVSNTLGMDLFHPNLDDELDRHYRIIERSLGEKEADRIIRDAKRDLLPVDLFQYKLTRPTNFREAMMDLAFRINHCQTDTVFLPDLPNMMEPWIRMTENSIYQYSIEAIQIATSTNSDTYPEEKSSALSDWLDQKVKDEIERVMFDFFRRIENEPKEVLISYTVTNINPLSEYLATHEEKAPTNVRFRSILRAAATPYDPIFHHIINIQLFGFTYSYIVDEEVYRNVIRAKIPAKYDDGLPGLKAFLEDNQWLVADREEGSKIALSIEGILSMDDTLPEKVREIKEYLKSKNLDQILLTCDMDHEVELCTQEWNDQHVSISQLPGWNELTKHLDWAKALDGRYNLVVRANCSLMNWVMLVNTLRKKCKYFRLERSIDN